MVASPDRPRGATLRPPAARDPIGDSMPPVRPSVPLTGPFVTSTSTSTAPDAGAGSDAGGRRAAPGLIGPILALLVIAVLAVATFGGGSDEPATAGDPSPQAGDDLDAAPSDTDGDTDPAEAIEESGAEPDAPGSGEPSADEVDEAAVRAQLDALATRDAEDPRGLGDADAPVVMIEWADYLCPYCQVVALDVEPDLIERYVDAGVLRIEWRDLPMQGEGAVITALAGRAAAEQDAFWEMHGRLFAAEYRRGDGRVSVESMRDHAEELCLDVARFEADLADDALLEQVAIEAQSAQAMGITGTPAFLINGRPLMGAQPAEVFEQAIREAAIEAGAQDALP